MKLTKQEFQENWSTTAAGWRGRNILRRNAVIATGNLGKRAGINRQGLVNELEILLQAESEEIGRAAAWAVKELNK
jgi:epoxyqueuosine reductase